MKADYQRSLINAVCSATVDVPQAITAPEFRGPFYTEDMSDFYFVCQVVYTGILKVDFDVSLTADGDRVSKSEVKLKDVNSMSSSLNVRFMSRDLKRLLGTKV